MSGFVFATSPCFGCKRLFTYNPHKVPSIRVPVAGAADVGQGVETTREPVCADCVARANPERVKRGLDPIEILPGAYEPMPEHEL